jgi:predicted phage baseplate assembly protein
MNAPAQTSPLDTCGCCEAGVPDPTLYNPPGLTALTYRLGTQPTILRRMLARLPAQAFPDGPNQGARPLAALGTRASDDPAIALLDAWATVADVLTFYQERIANEGFWRTATERRSLLELARAIGYTLRPGVAASTFLAFTVEDAPGSPGEAIVPQGAQVQSVPGQDQLPQVFETSAEILARAEWNALRPRLTQPQVLSLDAQIVYLVGTATNLKAGDPLLLVVRGTADSSAPPQTKVVRIRRVDIDNARNRTRVDLEDIPAKPTPTPASATPAAKVSLGKLTLNADQVGTTILQQSWREQDLTAFLAIQGWSGQNVTKYVNTPPPPPLPPADEGVFALRAKVGFYGHNAPMWTSLPSTENQRGTPYPNDWDANGGRTIWEDSQGTTYSESDPAVADVYLERSLPEVLSGSWVVVEGATVAPTVYRVGATTETSLTDYALSARATGLRLTQPDGTSAPAKPQDLKVRSSTAYVQSEGLALAELPIEEPLAPGTTTLELDRMVLGLQVGQALALTGERADLPGVTGSEVVFLADVQHSAGHTFLAFQEGLQFTYIRQTVALNANVARATHGETVVEVLGSGDGAQAHQRFTLKKPPLTYISAATATGTQSTLQVRVNDILWQEVPSLYGLGARDERFAVSIDDDGKAQVIFGDGEQGARLPTGTENIVATYRSGIGLPGMVAADTLTTLQTRPLGIRSVTNPLAATGAEDPESRDQARTNAPLTVLTLERIVSLRDFEDFTRGFAGIGKAQAVALWLGETHLVHLTVAAAGATAAPDGGLPALATHVVEAESELYSNLVQAIEAARDPLHPVVVASYQPVFFNVRAEVLVDPRYTVDGVLAAVEDALIAAFAFERRAFGQPVTAAEVVRVIHSVAGVVATDLDQLYRYRENEAPPDPEVEITPEVLEAVPVRWDEAAKTFHLAELLLINPVGITLTEMTP